jgi:selenocysteine lyase/cysteine desulfurase
MALAVLSSLEDIFKGIKKFTFEYSPDFMEAIINKLVDLLALNNHTMDKRSFLKNLGMLSLTGVPLWQSLDLLAKQTSHIPAEEIAKDEDFWEAIRSGYKLKPDYINLENGYYCFLPQEILESYLNHIREVNYQGSYYMRTVQWDNKKKMAARLAEIAGCTPEELIITRNTTESLDMIIGGQQWKAGDEAVMAEQDYGAMLDMFKQVERRYGVVNKIISVPNHPTSDEEIVKLYANAITDKTRLLMVCHMVNITGQILPIRKICDMAHSKGVEVLVDGAHAFAHINFSIPDLDCDYYGASLHKWLSVPLGAGILYVKKGKASKIWPLLGEEGRKEDDIYRLNHTGTHPVHTDLAIADSIDFYIKIGRDRKESRLHYLQNYWTSRVRNMPHIEVNTPEDPKRYCGIGNVGVKGMKPQLLAETLLKKYKIYTVAIDGAGVHGCRITPNLYTTTKELDAFVEALKTLG